MASDLPGDFLFDIPLRRIANEIVLALDAESERRNPRHAAIAQFRFRLAGIGHIEKRVEPGVVYAIPAVAGFRTPGRAECRVSDVDAIESSRENARGVLGRAVLLMK